MGYKYKFGVVSPNVKVTTFVLIQPSLEINDQLSFIYILVVCYLVSLLFALFLLLLNNCLFYYCPVACGCNSENQKTDSRCTKTMDGKTTGDTGKFLWLAQDSQENKSC